MTAGGLLEMLDSAGPPRARNTDPDTSHEAALSMTGPAGKQRRMIIDLLYEERRGLNAGEIDKALDWPVSTAGRRLHEMKKLGLVTKNGGTRPTPVGGRLAHIYVTTVAGRRLIWQERNGIDYGAKQ